MNENILKYEGRVYEAAPAAEPGLCGHEKNYCACAFHPVNGEYSYYSHDCREDHAVSCLPENRVDGTKVYWMRAEKDKNHEQKEKEA